LKLKPVKEGHPPWLLRGIHTVRQLLAEHPDIDNTRYFDKLNSEIQIDDNIGLVPPDILKVNIKPSYDLASIQLDKDVETEAAFDLNEGIYLENIGAFEAAAHFLDEAIEASKSTSKLETVLLNAYLERGFVLCTLERTKEALDDYQAAFALDPSRAEINGTIGILLESLGDPIAAASALRVATQVKSDAPEPWAGLVITLADLKDMVRSKAALQTALKLDARFGNSNCLLYEMRWNDNLVSKMEKLLVNK